MLWVRFASGSFVLPSACQKIHARSVGPKQRRHICRKTPEILVVFLLLPNERKTIWESTRDQAKAVEWPRLRTLHLNARLFCFFSDVAWRCVGMQNYLILCKMLSAFYSLVTTLLINIL